MAHAARISEIADNLVQSILKVDRNDPIIARTRTAVSRGLRDASHARTNQFEVKSRLDVQSVLEHEVRVYPREVRIEWVDIDVLLWVDP